MIPVCMVVGLVYAWALYRKWARGNSNIAAWMVYLLSGLRFVVVTTLALLVLNPLLKYLQRTIEKPVVFLAVDASESMVLGKDSAYVTQQLRQDVETFKERVKGKFEVIELSQSASPEAYTKTTNLARYFNDIESVHADRNSSALVMVTDGIYNQGMNPSYKAQRQKLPVFTVGLGDTTVYSDLLVYSAKTNAITFLGNEFPIEVVVNGVKAEGSNARISLWHEGKQVGKVETEVRSDRFSFKHRFMVSADKVGVQRYQIRVDGLGNEANKINNTKAVFTEVLDAQQKVLLLAHAPHPDVAALRSAIESNDQYELTVEVGAFSPVKQEEYDLVIAHQLPANSSEYNLMQRLKELNVPVWAVIGNSTRIDQLNRLQIVKQIKEHQNNYNRSLANLNTTFSLFAPEDEVSEYLADLPPLIVPFGQYEKPIAKNVLAYQKIGSVSTDMPLWYFTNNDGYKTGIICGEGVWRWRMYEREKTDDQLNFNRLVQQTIQYLALKEDKRRFRAATNATSYFENERVEFVAQVYNESYEFTPEADVNVTINHDDGTSYEYHLTPGNERYTHSVSSLPEGDYTYVVSSQFAGKQSTSIGKFTIKPMQFERNQLTANDKLLKQMAAETGGRYFEKEGWNSLAEEVMALPNAVAISKSSNRFNELINQKWLFFVLLSLLSIEWFVRRWSGEY